MATAAASRRGHLKIVFRELNDYFRKKNVSTRLHDQKWTLASSLAGGSVPVKIKSVLISVTKCVRNFATMSKFKKTLAIF